MNIEFPELLNEFISYGKEKKAEMAYHKCIRNNKLELANKIRKKYSLILKSDDFITAFQYEHRRIQGKDQ